MMPRKGFTIVELLLVLLIVALIVFFPWCIYKLFHAQTEIDAIKWGAFLISLAIGSAQQGSAK